MTAGWTPAAGAFPVAPTNGAVVSSLTKGALDIRWDDPSLLGANTVWTVVGVNIYRSDDGERGPYHRINQFPVAANFFRDITDNALVTNEIVHWGSAWVSRGNAPNNPRWTFKTKNCPVVKKNGNSVFADAPYDVMVTIDGVEAQVHAVFGPTGEITLVDQGDFDAVRNRSLPPVLPNADGSSEVLVTYRYRRNHVVTNLGHRPFYRITTVAEEDPDDPTPTGLIETPLEYTPPLTHQMVENLDYIWTEAIRRNNWILEQGGERAKVFLKKRSGIVCYCGRDPRTIEIARKPDSRCVRCYGTGFLGGYEGPYELIIPPDDTQRTIRQNPNGRQQDHTQDVWTGPTPLLSHRDFIVKQSNDRYSIGGITTYAARGALLQQHFQMKYLDEEDIRYRVPIDGVASLAWPTTRVLVNPDVPYPVGADRQSLPMETEKSNIPDDRPERRGRTPTWENITY